MRIVFTLTVALALFTISKLSAQPGTLDSSFGVNGKVTTTNGNNAAIARQPDGKILVVGTMGNFDPDGFHSAISRYTTNGSVDSTFGVNGKVETYFDSGRYLGFIATSLLIQPDEKILVGGYVYHIPYGPDVYALVRYLSDGTLDSSFGTNGKEQDFIGGECELYSLCLLTNSSIIAGGWVDGYCVVKYTSNGHIDSSFAKQGILRDQDFYGGAVNDLLIQKDGKIITASADAYDWSVPADFLINRISSNGSFDSSFATNGFALTNFYGGNDEAFSVAQLNDSTFIAGGYAKNDTTSTTYTAFTVYKKNGNLFRPFGVKGKTTIVSPTGGNMRILIDSYGRIISAGSILVRLKTDGTVDSTFGNNGKALNFEGALDAVLQPDQEIITMNSGSLQRFKGDPATISIAKNISLTEGNAGYTAAKFKIVLNHPAASTVKVDYTTKDGTAHAGSDYVSTGGTATIKPGNVSKMITVNVIGDLTYENNEKFSVVLTNPLNALLGDLDSATCTIKNDDPLSPESQTNNRASFANSEIKLYPNPVKNELNVERITGNAELSIVDIQGKELIKTTAEYQTRTIDVKKLSPGVYYLRVESANGITTLKFVKQ